MESGEESMDRRASNTEMGADFDIGDDEIGSDPTVGEKRKRTSTVWNHFKRIKIEDAYYAICNYCNAQLTARGASGTSHLSKHYNKTCKKRPKGRPSPQELAAHVFSQEDSRIKLAEMVILHDYPLSIVDHVGFRGFVASLQPCFKMISRNTLKNDILSIYKSEKIKCYKMLEKLKCRIAITTDMWTSNNTKKGFMAITAHYVDESWNLRSCILRFVYIPAPHTAEAISDVLLESRMDWNIDRKVSAITVDNATTNDAMLTIILEKLSRLDLLLDGKVLHMRCWAYILNLIVRDGLEVIAHAIERIRDSVIYWTASPARIEKFEEIANQMHVACTRKLSLDCRTRWNSTYLMLETAIEYRNVFPRLKYRERNYKCLPTEQDWVDATAICGKLKIFYEATLTFSGTLYPTSNFYFSKFCDIKLRLDEWATSTTEMIKNMAKKMLEKYEKYWNTCNVMMGVAAVLDPRFKLEVVEFYFSLICGEESEVKAAKVDEIRKNCYDMLADYKSRAAVLGEGSLNISGVGSSGSTTGVSGVTNDHLELYDRFVASKRRPTTVLSQTSELDMYLSENVLPRAENFDVLSWWKTNGVKYPILQKMAKDILAIPVSTVASESAFSSSGRLISPHRNRLNPITLEALMCTRRWLWNATEVKGVCPTLFDDEEDDIEECISESDTFVCGLSSV